MSIETLKNKLEKKMSKYKSIKNEIQNLEKDIMTLENKIKILEAEEITNTIEQYNISMSEAARLLNELLKKRERENEENSTYQTRHE